MRIDRLISTSAILLFLGGCAAQGQDTAQTSAHGPHAPSADGGHAVLYNTLGGYSYRITTSSAEAEWCHSTRNHELAVIAVPDAGPVALFAESKMTRNPAVVNRISHR